MLWTKNLTKQLYTQAVQNLSSAETLFKKSIVINRMSKQVIWVTSRNLSSLVTFFIYEAPREVVVKFCPKPILYSKVWSARNTDSETGQVSDCHNTQTANHLEPYNEPLESWESCLPKQYSGLLEFWPIRDWELRIHYASALSRCRIQQRHRSSKFHNI
jgi:hypothetical protein